MSEKELYFRVSILALGIFAATYFYTSWLKTPNVLNKSVADTSVILIGLSMILSGLCYFWNFVDSKIVYRKHLGLVGFAFGVVHLLLSYAAFVKLFQVATWQQNAMWPMLTGTLALIIFAVMALVSNRYAAQQLGGVTWRRILRTGYISLVLVFAHVVILKSMRWMTWFTDGMKTPPSVSLIVSVFVLMVLLMRIALWWSLKRKSNSV